MVKLFSMIGPDLTKTVIRMDTETVLAIVMLNCFVVAPYMLGQQYNAIMGHVVENLWQIAIAAVAPISLKHGGKLLNRGGGNGEANGTR